MFTPRDDFLVLKLQFDRSRIVLNPRSLCTDVLSLRPSYPDVHGTLGLAVAPLANSGATTLCVPSQFGVSSGRG